jgi:asparagine synthase (glutamine-hydrolysing)
MCGLAGLQGQLTLPSKDILAHRGPDAFGQYQAQETQLFHWRLSILDLSEAGNQPMSNETGKLWLIFNGEIYNFQTLRLELEHKGHRFRSQSDSEVLLHLYEEYGQEMLPKLRGMFALALYDEVQEELFLARDPFGIKPLVYSELPEGFAFASELRLLASLPEFPRTIDPAAVEFYFRLNYIPAPWTIWKNARKLRPGHFLRVRQGRIIQEGRYTSLVSQPWPGSVEAAEEALRATLVESVRAHLISDVPLGAFLSGGLDSSLVVAMAQETLNSPIQTFTVSFPEFPHYDEGSYARETAKLLGTNHTEIPITAAQAQQVLEEMVDHLDEPFADSSLIPSAIVTSATRQHVKVALSGDGGDELFAGYNKYQGLHLAEQALPLAPLLKGLAHLPLPERRGTPWGDRVRQFRKLTRLLEKVPSVRLMRSMEVLSERDFGQVVNTLQNNGLIQEQLDQLLAEAETAGFLDLNKVLYLDAHFVLPYDMLFKVDTASMAHALEVRVPFVDIEVARLAFSFPGDWKLKGYQRKWILRQIAQHYLPASILNRPKWGFGIPIGEWIRKDLKALFQETLSPVQVTRGGILNSQAIERLFSEHLSQRYDRFWELWSLFVFERWRAKYC